MSKKYLTWFLVAVVVALPILLGCGLTNFLAQATPVPTPETTPVQAVTVAAATATVAPTPTAAPTPATQAQVPQASTSLLASFEGTLQEVYAKVNPSVVNIQVLVQPSMGSPPVPEVPGSPFGPQQPQPQQGLGSGFVWDQEGHIVTNNHVVEQADQIGVTFTDGTFAPGEVIGSDRDSDLAVIQVDVPANRLQPVEMGDSGQVNIGQLAIAIGNPFGLSGTMTMGIISALGRSLPVEPQTMQGPTYTIPDIIQTDAPINPGNSGGVLVNDQGQVIGVTAAIRSPVQANAGIGFAIPSAIVRKVVPSLIETGGYQHPWLGISGNTLAPALAEAMDLPSDQRGVLVVDVVDGSPADQAGIQGSDRQVDISGLQVRVGGDVIVGIEGQPVNQFDDIVTYLARNTTVGDTVTLTVLRDGQQQMIDVNLEARPQQQGQGQAQTGPSPQFANTWLGIIGTGLVPEIAQAMDLPSGEQGILVGQVVQGSPADEAGLRGSYKPVVINGQTIQVGGDVITAVDGQPMTEVGDLTAFLQQGEPGQTVTLSILRNGEEMQIQATLQAPPVSQP